MIMNNFKNLVFYYIMLEINIFNVKYGDWGLGKQLKFLFVAFKDIILNKAGNIYKTKGYNIPKRKLVNESLIKII